MALKPVPKLILIVAVVGGVGYALMNTSSWLPKKAEAPKQEVPVTVVAPSGPKPEAQQPQVQQQAPAPALQQAGDAPPLRPTTSDNGLSAVLGAGKK